MEGIHNRLRQGIREITKNVLLKEMDHTVNHNDFRR